MAATVTGIFRIIDRASPAMRGMERQAIKTDLAVAKLGSSLDGVGARKQLRQLETASRSVKTFGTEVDNVERRVSRADRSLVNLERSGTRVGRAFQGATRHLSAFRSVLKPAIFIGLAAAIGVLVQGVGALSGGVIALLPRLSDMVGLAAPAAAGFAGLGIVLISSKLAFNNLSKAMAGNKKALASLTPEARSFLQTLKSYRPVLNELRAASQQGLFPGLDRALQKLRSAVPTGRRLLSGGGRAAGNLADEAAGRLAKPGNLADVERIGNQGIRMFSMAGEALMSLLDVVRHFAVAAGPFTDWLSKSIVLWARHRAEIAKFNRDSGKTGAYLDRTRRSLTNFWHIAQNLWATFRNLGRAARPLGDDLWRSAEKATKRWKELTSTVDSRVGLTKDFLNMGTAIHEIMGLVGDLGKAIFRMGTNPGLPGTVRALRGLVPSLEKVLNLFANTFGPPLARLLATAGNTLELLAGATGPFVMMVDILERTLRLINGITGAIPGMGKVLGAALSVFLIQRFLVKLGLLEAGWYRVARAAGVAAAAEGAATMGGFGGGVGRGGGAVSPFMYGMRSGRAGNKIMGGFGPMAKAGNILGRSRGFGSLAAGASRLGRVATPLGIATAGAGLGMQFLPVSHRAKSIGSAAATGAGLGAMVGSVVPVLGTALGAGIGGLAGAGYGLLSSRGDETDKINRVTGGVKSELGIIEKMHMYPTEIGRMTAQLQVFQNARAQLERMHSAAAQQELAQVNAEIQARKAVVAQLNAERKEKIRAHAMSRVQGIAADLQHVFNTLRGSGTSLHSAAGTVARLGIGDLATVKDPKARFSLAKGLLNWERKTLGAKDPQFEALRDRLTALVPGLLKPGQKGFRATGSRSEIQNILDRMNPRAGKGGHFEQLLQARRKPPTPLQAALIAELVLGGRLTGAQAYAAVMRADATGHAPYKLVSPAQIARNRAINERSGQMMPRSHAHGGRVPGQGLSDSVMVAPGAMAAPNELIVNRHTEGRVNRLLGMFGTSLGGEVGGETKKHSDHFAKGGRVGMRGHIKGVMGAVLGAIPGLSVTSTTGGTHAKNSFHYLGEAVDIGGSAGAMSRAAAWIMQSGLYHQLAEGIHNTGLSVKNGKIVSPSFWGSKTWAGHANHLHLAAIGGAMGAITGGVGGAVGVGGARGTSPGRAINMSGPVGHEARALAAARSIMGFPTSGGGGGGGGAAAPGAAAPSPGSADPTGNRLLGQRMMLAHGWGMDQWPALEKLWTGESGWNHLAKNPSSGAYGIPQSLPASKMASAGPDWASNPRTQIAWGLNYISGRYKSPSNALDAWQGRSPHWYAKGGRVGWGGWFGNGGSFTTNGPTMMGVGEKGKERVTVEKVGAGASARHGGLTLSIGEVNLHGSMEEMAAQFEEMLVSSWAKFAEELERTSPETLR